MDKPLTYSVGGVGWLRGYLETLHYSFKSQGFKQVSAKEDRAYRLKGRS
jgi:hypothetical protein